MNEQTQGQKLERWNRNNLTRKYYAQLEEGINYLKCQLSLRKAMEASNGISHVSVYIELPPPDASRTKGCP